MAFGQPSYPYYNAPTSYQPAAYPQPMTSYQPRQDFTQQPQSSDVLFARIVSCREEAVASQIIPDGRPNLFYCPTEQCVFVKRIDPSTNVSSFETCPFPKRVQPAQQPQEAPQQAAQEFVPVSEFKALQDKFEALEEDFASMRAAFSQPKQTSRKVAVSNDE